jgi:glycine betaine/proline transport system ATP-binding protein
MSETVVKATGVWKVFGEQADAAIKAIRDEGIGKPEVLERFGCVVGVQDATFEVARGEIFCIMGLSGSGKSTLVRHVNRLIEPTAGSIELLGRDVSSLNQTDLREMRARHIGMVFQHMALMPHRSVRDNVAYPLEIRGVAKSKRWAVSDHALGLVDLVGYEDRLPKELSGGMQQRVGIARALAADPEVLLMDEPFSALDPLIRMQLQDQFKALVAQLQKTTLFITHDLDEAIRIGHRIAIRNRHEPGRRLRAGIRAGYFQAQAGEGAFDPRIAGHLPGRPDRRAARRRGRRSGPVDRSRGRHRPAGRYHLRRQGHRPGDQAAAVTRNPGG